MLHGQEVRRDQERQADLGGPQVRPRDRLLPHREAAQPGGAAGRRVHGRVLPGEDQSRLRRLDPRRRHHRGVNDRACQVRCRRRTPHRRRRRPAQPHLVEIAALGLPGALAHLAVGARHAGGAVAERAQLVAEIDQLVGDDVDDEALALDPAAHLQELRRHDDAAVPLEHLGPDHDVDDAGLVLEREEDHALGGARALPHQHEAGHA